MNPTSQSLRRTLATCGAAVALATAASPANAAPIVSRLTPPSVLFSFGDPTPPITSRFLPGQRFDLHATVSPDSGQTITEVKFSVDGREVPGGVALTPANASGLRANSVNAILRAFETEAAGIRNLSVRARQSDGQIVTAEGNFEIVSLQGSGPHGPTAKNVIMMIGDGMGIAHRTAARIMANGIVQGKSNGPLAMDTFPVTGMVSTHSLNSIVTDSSPGAACYATGNKSNNNQHGVFPDDTNPVSGNGSANFDNPRVELITEYFNRTQSRGNRRDAMPAKSLGIVTTSDVFDATPASFGSHTQSRAAGTGICDQYLDERGLTGLTVLMGGGRKWFLPNNVPGSARSNSSDYVLPNDLAQGWGVPAGSLDAGRDLIGDFQRAGFTYVADAGQMNSISANTTRLLGLFSLSNMNVALDKIDARRGNPAVVNDYGFPDQPMLDEMTDKALQVLRRNPNGFVLMVEGASIDKQAHNMDTERWILDTIEFDRAVAKARDFAAANPDTLVLVLADHECAGINIIGGSRVSDAELQNRGTLRGGTATLRNGVVGTYEAAGFPRYETAPDGYPITTNVNNRMLIGYAANADRNEDWRTNQRPLRDSQQPFNNQPPLNTYPASPTDRDQNGGFFVTGQIPDNVAAHTASDIPISAFGVGAGLFSGVMDNTDVFFRAMQVAVPPRRPTPGSRR